MEIMEIEIMNWDKFDKSLCYIILLLIFSLHLHGLPCNHIVLCEWLLLRYSERSIHELYHGKTRLKIFVVVIPKQGLASVAPPILPLV